MPGAMSSQPEVNVRMIGWVQNPQLEVGGPTVDWLRPETLVELTIEGRNFTALVDSGSQVNMIMPTLVQQCGFPVLPLEDLVDYSVNLVGLGGMCTSRSGLSSCMCKCGASQDMMRTWCSWWCPMSPILDEGSLWLWGPALSADLSTLSMRAR